MLDHAQISMYIVHMSNLSVAEQVAEKVSLAIFNAGKNKSQIAKDTGIPYATLHRKLKGRGELTFSELMLISTAIGVRPSQFMPEHFQQVA